MVSSVDPQQHPSEIAVVMVPLPAQGHLNPLLHLSAHIASRRLIHVHYVSSSPHNRQARQRLHGWNLSSSSSHLHFHDLPFPSPPPPPPSNPLTTTTKFPSHLQPSFDASASHLLPHLSSLLLSLSLSHRRVVLLHDFSMSFANAAASPLFPKTESFAFHTASAISNLVFLGKSGRLCRARFSPSCFSEEFLDWLCRQRRTPVALSGRLFNTCRGIEGEFLDRLSKEEPSWDGQRVFAVGPLNPIVTRSSWRHSEDEYCLEWLDQQPAASVLYVSFGTTASMSREQVREIAAGLEMSERRFVWVRREADRCDIFEAGEEGEEDSELAELEER